MPKTKNFPKQPSFFHREVPRMPEGYYSSGPNSNLSHFVIEHSKPYDPTTDEYDVPSFDHPISATKATAIYNMHSYHQGKKPYDAIQQYIRHYTQTKDIVLDLFSGSGSTALAALMEGRVPIAIDLSPAATFITKNYCTPVNIDDLQRSFDVLEVKVKQEMDWLYETRCDRCDGRATTAYTVYSYVFQCPRCLTKLPLFDCIEASSQTAAGKDKKIRVCPYCLSHGHKEEIKTTSQRFDTVPVLVAYQCLEGCKGESERRHNDSDPKKRAYFEKYDLAKIAEIEKKDIPHWYPQHRMMNVESNTESWGDKWRAGTSNFRTIGELFTKRNLWALASLLNSINHNEFGDVFRFGFEAVLINLSRLQGNTTDPRFPNNIIRGTYYMPQIMREYNVFPWYKGKLRNLINGYKSISQFYENFSTCCISTQSATNLNSIPSDTIDFIFTDPPYGSQVQYGEMNFVWEAWMGFSTNWHKEEIIVNKTRGVSDDDWANLMQKAMRECFRVLKPGRWLSLCYHDTSEGTWALVQDILAEIGFVVDNSGISLFIDTKEKSFNQLTAEKVTMRDLVINFRKPRPEELTPFAIITGDEDATTFTEKARLILIDNLEIHPGSTVDRLYDELVSRMVRKGEFERHNFDKLLRSVAEEVDSRWYLLTTADQVDAAESKKETSSAVRLETFMQNYLKEHSSDSGIHYSDLFEHYLPIKDKPRRLLQDLLPEFFFKTVDGTWRPPTTDEERQQKAALRSSGALRRIKRFTSALMDGVPPYERDKPENAVTMTDWIRQCRRTGFYDLGRALYEKGGLQFDELNEEAKLQVEEDYQICVRRGEQSVKLKTKKTRQLSLSEMDQP